MFAALWFRLIDLWGDLSGRAAEGQTGPAVVGATDVAGVRWWWGSHTQTEEARRDHRGSQPTARSHLLYVCSQSDVQSPLLASQALYSHPYTVQQLL
jgi:hypothetical protein